MPRIKLRTGIHILLGKNHLNTAPFTIYYSVTSYSLFKGTAEEREWQPRGWKELWVEEFKSQVQALES